MNNIILFCVLAAILGGAVWYVVSEKKKGNKCIGCSCGCSNTDHCEGKKD